MDKWLTLHEAVKSCTCIPEESKIIFIQGLHSIIDLYKSELTHKKLLNDRYDISDKDDFDKADNLGMKLKDGIKFAKKLKPIVSSIDKGNSTLIYALNDFIENAQCSLKIEQPKRKNKGGQTEIINHKIALSFKSLWDAYITIDENESNAVKLANCEAVKLATELFYASGIIVKPDSKDEQNADRKRVKNIIKQRSDLKGQVTPFFQVAKVK